MKRLKILMIIVLLVYPMARAGTFTSLGGGPLSPGLTAEKISKAIGKDSNCKIIYPGDDIQTAYDWLKSSDRDGQMGALAYDNWRWIVGIGKFDVTQLEVDTNFVGFTSLTGNRYDFVIDGSDGSSSESTILQTAQYAAFINLSIYPNEDYDAAVNVLDGDGLLINNNWTGTCSTNGTSITLDTERVVVDGTMNLEWPDEILLWKNPTTYGGADGFQTTACKIVSRSASVLTVDESFGSFSGVNYIIVPQNSRYENLYLKGYIGASNLAWKCHAGGICKNIISGDYALRVVPSTGSSATPQTAPVMASSITDRTGDYGYGAASFTVDVSYTDGLKKGDYIRSITPPAGHLSGAFPVLAVFDTSPVTVVIRLHTGFTAKTFTPRPVYNVCDTQARFYLQDYWGRDDTLIGDMCGVCNITAKNIRVRNESFAGCSTWAGPIGEDAYIDGVYCGDKCLSLGMGVEGAAIIKNVWGGDYCLGGYSSSFYKGRIYEATLENIHLGSTNSLTSGDTATNYGFIANSTLRNVTAGLGSRLDIVDSKIMGCDFTFSENGGDGISLHDDSTQIYNSRIFVLSSGAGIPVVTDGTARSVVAANVITNNDGDTDNDGFGDDNDNGNGAGDVVTIVGENNTNCGNID